MKKEKFEYETYISKGINNLILFSINSVEDKKGKCTFEMLVKECFELFPRAFCFKTIKWPDSRKLDRPLRELRRKKMINGGPKSVFSLTKAGKNSAEGVAKALGQGRLKI